MSERERKRRRRYERQADPGRMRLMPRDEQVIEAVYHYRILTTSQIARLHFTNAHISVAHTRLRKLFDAGYLYRQSLPTSSPGVNNNEMIYMLDERGGQHLIARLGYDEIRWKRAHNSVGYEFIEHLVAINTFRIEVELACSATGHELVEWRDDTTLKQDYDRVYIANRRQPVAVIPDGYFAIQVPAGRMHFFLEMDRGNMESERFKRKIAMYDAYWRSELSQRRFGTQNFRVLTVTESARRTANLKIATERANGGKRFWFGTLSDFTQALVLTGPVWQIAGSDDLWQIIP